MAEVINIKWNEVISTDKADTQHSFELFDQKMNDILDKHVPLKKKKKELRLRTKPWITHGLIKSIKRHDNLLRKFIKTKDIGKKNDIHSRYKILRNQIVAITRKSKKLHFQKYFFDNAKNIRKTWTGIKNIINIRAITKN